MSGRLVILGAGGFAREALWYALSAGISSIVFVDETVSADSRLTCGARSYTIVNDWSQFKETSALAEFREFIVAVGSPALKLKLATAAIACGLTPAKTLIHATAHVHGDDCTIGVGGIIAPGCHLTTNITIGDFVTLGINCLVGHDATIGDYVSCHPGSQLSGNVIIEAGVLIGTGACVRERLRIATNVTVGAQGCVVRDVVTPGSTIAGVPARPLSST